MRSFHTSGSANLDISDSARKFITDHIIDIRNDENSIILYFNNSDFPKSLFKINGFNKIEGNSIIFDNHNEEIINIDAVSIMKNVKELLKSIVNPKKTPSEYYEELMGYILEVGKLYSSFVEMFFANIFVCDKKATEFWRYNQTKSIYKKFGDTTISQNISKLLGLLYQPNKKSLEQITEFEDIDLKDTSNLNIYEKIWLGHYQ